MRGLLLGSVTAKVMHDATCPVWMNPLVNLARERPRTGISRIVCGIELAEEAVPLLRFTHELAKKLGAGVQAVHGVPELESRPNKYFDFDLHQYLVDSARVEIAKFQRQAGTDFPLTVSGKPISQAIADAAIENRADLVVIGRGKCQ
jgi:nucleotide-binding universal stress UspA family protein